VTIIDLDHLDNDLAGWLERTLVRRGLLAPSDFQDAFVAIVTSAAGDPDQAWLAFYRNTMAALAGVATPGGELKPVHERAATLAIGPDVVELGCCFGFLSLRLAAAGHRVTAVDVCPGTIQLLCRTAPRLGLDGDALVALVADARAVPRPTGSADTVFAVHLLEHLPEQAGRDVLAEMLRLARRRTVVAVPYEDTPNPTWGHVRRFDAAALTELGEWSRRPYTVTEHHGGWLIIDL
jgi:SAM-dependent methyltransferase